MNFKNILQLALVLYLLVPMSCSSFLCDSSSCGCDDPDDLPQYSKVKSMSMVVGNLEIEQYPYTFILNDTTTDYRSTGMKINVEEVHEYDELPEASAFNFSLVSSAFACTLAGPSPIDEIDSIKITCSNDLLINDTTIASGTDLSSYFTLFDYYNDEFMDVSEFVGRNELGYFGSIESVIYLRLKDFVLIENTSISVNISFKEGEDIFLTTDEFTVKY